MGRAARGKMALRATVARRGIFTPVIDMAANMYAKSFGAQLNKYGLRFEDVYTETPELMEAISRLSPAEQEARSMRIRRAQDLSFKKMYLPDHMQEANEPFKQYLGDTLRQVEKETWEQKEFD